MFTVSIETNAISKRWTDNDQSNSMWKINARSQHTFVMMQKNSNTHTQLPMRCVQMMAMKKEMFDPHVNLHSVRRLLPQLRSRCMLNIFSANARFCIRTFSGISKRFPWYDHSFWVRENQTVILLTREINDTTTNSQRVTRMNT